MPQWSVYCVFLSGAISRPITVGRASRWRVALNGFSVRSNYVIKSSVVVVVVAVVACYLHSIDRELPANHVEIAQWGPLIQQLAYLRINLNRNEAAR